MAGQKQIGWGKLVATALLSALFVTSALFALVPKAHATPNSTYGWVDVNTILGTGGGADERFLLNADLSQSGAKKYVNVVAGATCNSPVISVPIGGGTITLDWETPAGGVGNNSCVPHTQTISSITNQGNSTITFDWVDSATIQQIQENVSGGIGGNIKFQLDASDPAKFWSGSNSDTCIDYITVNSNKVSGVYHQPTPDANGACIDHTSNVQLGIPANAAGTGTPTTTGPGTGGGGGSGTGGGQTDPSLACDFVSPNPLNWILCPIVKGINIVISQLDNAINSFLTVDQDKIFNTANPIGAAYHNAWLTFRGFSLALLLIAGLFMVIAQSLGFELLDAYTIKKILPRLILAVIGIALSWDLMHFFVGLTNDLGLGIRHIIFYPFKDFPSELKLGGGSEFLLTLAGGAAILTLGIMGLLSFLGTAVLAILIAFLVLIVRQLLIVVLVLFAPIAIACSILPNTQQVYKLWYESFTKAMLMFPIIVAFLTLGRVFAVTSIGGNISSAPAISQLISFAAYIMPYFLIPFTFKFAGGALRTIGGSINDKNRGAFDRLKKYRGGQVAKNTHAMKTGTRYEGSKFVPGSRSLAKGFNSTTIGLGTGVQGHFGLGTRGSQAIDQTRRTASGDLLKDPRQNAIKDDENALRAQTWQDEGKAFAGVRDFQIKNDKTGRSATEVRASAEKEAKRAVASAKAATGFGKVQAFTAAQQLVNTGTGYTDIEDMAATLARASGGNTSTATSLAGYANSATKSAGRHDLAPSFGKLNSLVQSELTQSKTNVAQNPAQRAADYAEAGEAAWGSASLYQHANDKGKNIENHIKTFAPMLRDVDNSTPERAKASAARREKAAVFFNEIRSMQPNASGDVKDKIQAALAANQSNIEALYAAGSATALQHTPGGANSRPTGSQEVSVLDPLTGNRTRTTSPATGVAPESAKQRVERQSRTYERPDPANM